MQDILSILQTLHRPQLLMRAARIGAVEYRRSAHLPRFLRYGRTPKTAAALLKLIEYEDELNIQRKSGESAYNLVRHLDVLIAIVGEARILRASQPNG
jgi:hypothetical protein